MHFPIPILSLLLVALPQLSHFLPILQKRDADLASMAGLTTVTRDYSGKRGDHPDKYFHESTFHSHYDGRFASTTLPSTTLPSPTRRLHLTHLVQSYLSTMQSLNAETWLMHGSLLGWWWSKRIMPWDSDIDVQVSERTIEFLARYYNMTVHRFEVPVIEEEEEDGMGMGTGTGMGISNGEEREKKTEAKNYLLEINPHYTNPSTSDSLNVIDARWIDTSTGLCIDITTLRRNNTALNPSHMMCKDKHHYLSHQIFPLRETTFEGVSVKIPYAYAEVLREEYGAEALVKTVFEGHVFIKGEREWIPWNGKK